jgi:hypothetical protein
MALGQVFVVLSKSRICLPVSCPADRSWVRKAFAWNTAHWREAMYSLQSVTVAVNVLNFTSTSTGHHDDTVLLVPRVTLHSLLLLASCEMLNAVRFLYKTIQVNL